MDPEMIAKIAREAAEKAIAIRADMDEAEASDLDKLAAKIHAMLAESIAPMLAAAAKGEESEDSMDAMRADLDKMAAERDALQAEADALTAKIQEMEADRPSEDMSQERADSLRAVLDRRDALQSALAAHKIDTAGKDLPTLRRELAIATGADSVRCDSAGYVDAWIDLQAAKVKAEPATKPFRADSADAEIVLYPLTTREVI